MQKQVVLAGKPQVAVEARLLPQLQLCAGGFEGFKWVSVDSLSERSVLDQWIDRPPDALIVDWRTAHLPQHPIPTVAPANNIIAVVDDLSSAVCTKLARGKYTVTTIDEIGSGRLGLLLEQLALNPPTLKTSPLKNSAGDDEAVLACAARDEAGERATADTNKGSAAVSLNQIAFEMINRVDLSVLLRHITDKTCTLTNAAYTFVAMVHESEEYLETIATNNDTCNLQAVRHKRGEGAAGQAWQTGKTVCEPDYQSYSHRLSGLTAIEQACSVPLKLGDRVIGVFGIVYENCDQRIEDQVEVLEMFASLAAVAIDNAALLQNTRLELARTEAISDISRTIYGAASFDVIIEKICSTLIEKFDATKAHIYRLEQDGSYTPLAALQNVGGQISPTEQADSETVAQSVASWCIENRQSAHIKRGVNDQRESIDIHQIRKKWRLGSTICLPLFHANKSWGVLFTHRSIDRSDFTECEHKQFELIAVQISIALLRRELMLKVERQAFYDSLTGLYNRWRFESILLQSVEKASNSSECYAVLSIDLVGFKAVNDAYGHKVGDKFLQKVASRLSSQVSAKDILARMGGDEFSIIASARAGREDIMLLAQQITQTLSEPIEVGNLRITAGVCIGICFFPDDAESVDEVIKHAGFALYRAKNTEQISISVFNHTLLADHENSQQLELDLRYALATSQFELHYQPKVGCVSGLVDGVEALIRWNHPERGFVPPSQFIPVAERCGLIQEIGAWVLEQACQDCAEFQQNHGALKVAVNISAQQFNVDDFVPSVFATLDAHGLSANCLELEVTESVVMHDISKVVDKLAQLQGSGVTIAIDDFGTGYSSLQYLAELPLDVLKIDKSFINRIDDASDGALLVKTILMMSRELNLKTVAEGVETASQQTQLQQLSCDYIQGYYYSKPVPASQLSEVINWLNQQVVSEEVA